MTRRKAPPLSNSLLARNPLPSKPSVLQIMGQPTSRFDEENGPKRYSTLLRGAMPSGVWLMRPVQISSSRSPTSLAVVTIHMVLGLPDSEEGKCFTLEPESSGRWVLGDFIHLPAELDGIHCFVKSDENEDAAFIYLECLGMQETDAGLRRVRHDMEGCDEGLRLTLAYNVVRLSGDSTDEIDASSLEHDQLARYGLICSDRFEHSGEISHLDEAISAFKKLVQLVPKGDARVPYTLKHLAHLLRTRYERTEDIEDVTGAINAMRMIVELAPEGHELLSMALQTLAVLLCLRVRKLWHLSDMEEALSALQRAVGIAPEGQQQDLVLLLNRVARLFEHRARLTGDHSDITSGDFMHPEQLAALGRSLVERFEYTGNTSDVAEAIHLQEKAVKLDAEEDPELLASLSHSLAKRINHRANRADMDRAIALQRRVMELVPQGNHLHTMTALSHLLSMLQRATYTNDPRDSEAYLLARRNFEDHSPAQREPEVPMTAESELISLLTLHHAPMARFSETGSLEHLDELISVKRRIVDLYRRDDGARAFLPRVLKTLAGDYMARFNITGNRSDIAEHIASLRETARITPQGHMDLGEVLFCLGNTLYELFKLTADAQDLEDSITALKSAASYPFGISLGRFGAAYVWCDASCRRLLAALTAGAPTQGEAGPLEALVTGPEASDMFDAYGTAVRLSTHIIGLEGPLEEKLSRLQVVQVVPHMVSQGAAMACDCGQVEQALEWLEHGRCLVWSQLSNLRSPLEELFQHDRQLATEVSDTSQRLQDTPSSRDIGMFLSESDLPEVSARIELVKKWEHLLQTVRAISGFETFLQPATCSFLLRNLPDSGPIIVINGSGHRCHATALIAGLEQPLHIPLPDFSEDKALKYRTEWMTQLRCQGLRVRSDEGTTENCIERGIRSYRTRQRQNTVRVILQSLWAEVVKPILDALGFSKKEPSSRDVLPRVWWCPTGPLSFLPIHAAGIYGGDHPECVLDYAVSSYTPTVTAVTDRVKRCQSSGEHAFGLFLTCQPHPPGASSIPGTISEVQSIYAGAEGNGVNARLVEGDEVAVEGCLEYMEEYSCVHLACHASQNASDPLKSRFIFHNGTLDLATIIQRDLKNADLAFLSACETSTGEETLPDEAVHLAAGMLAAGYRRVVATMWAIGDKHAPEVAGEFYKYMWSHGEKDDEGVIRFNGSQSAHALHHSIQKLRLILGDSETSLLAWIPYVHFGY